MKIFHGKPDGFYIRSSADSGEECAIRIYYAAGEQTFNFNLSSEEAIAFAEELILVAKKFNKGEETRPRASELIYDNQQCCD